ncbi:anti-Muellerian hormone type-2 receptor [Numida meleagris]|uniref:anti-Muellerian hormone type-2 receptor n=1 Tax=Numida meleagris TaxID=8996 RepID=UPI000B3DDA6B|nr:anti-Muellerian hormone type-2 receptor [Numida meleagris]
MGGGGVPARLGWGVHKGLGGPQGWGVLVSPRSLSPAPSNVPPMGTLWLWGAVPLLLLLLLTCLAALGRRRAWAQMGRMPQGHRGLRAPPKPPSPDLPALRFLQVLQAGRFSAVWRGTLQQRPVAIKAFAAGGARRFAAERAVHALPLMEHENVAKLLGTRGAGPCARGGLLVLQLYPAVSAPGGGGLHLVQAWPWCKHDFGASMALVQAWLWCKHGPAVSTALVQAGTQRYLAPEILDESLDLRSWGRALRQADVYALALLLWEILSRCQTLSPGSPVPEFRLAYEAELGGSPTAAQLRHLAVEERRRPLIPPTWQHTAQPSGALQELLEDCWDPDPEARLSAERALQRLQRLAAPPEPPPRS